MKNFPAFMKHPANRIDRGDQHTPGIEGYVMEGADGSQMAFWTISQDAESEAHTHEYDEYMAVMHGKYTLVIGGEEIPLAAGQEFVIARGVRHGGRAVAGTRTIHFFNGRRCRREFETGSE